jgi:hypothetical protein
MSLSLGLKTLTESKLKSEINFESHGFFLSRFCKQIKFSLCKTSNVPCLMDQMCSLTNYVSSVMQRPWNLEIRNIIISDDPFSFHRIFFLRISNFFDLSITEETIVVEMHIWCIKLGNVLVLHCKELGGKGCHDIEPYPSKGKDMHEGDDLSFWNEFITFYMYF